MGVALRTPLGHDAALQLLSSFFDALIRENHSLLSKTTNGRASLHDLRPRARRTAYHAGHVWRGRFRKRSYEKLRDILVFRPSDVITYDRKSYQRLPRPLRQKAKPKLDNQDLVLQVPLLVHTLNGRRYLAEEMTFWLERQQGRYVITHIAEVFPF